MISYNIIATGSQGNAVIIGGQILVDCGVPFKTIEPYLRQISLVLLTHIHSDHYNPATVRAMAHQKPLLRIAGCRWMMKPLIDAGVRASQVDMMDCDAIYDYREFEVGPVMLNHDVPNCGYKLLFKGGKAFYATDTFSLNGISAPNYDLYLIESNYTDEDIRRRMSEKKVDGGYLYEQRVIKTHLSKQKADDFIFRNIGANGRYVYLHQHNPEGD